MLLRYALGVRPVARWKYLVKVGASGKFRDDAISLMDSCPSFSMVLASPATTVSIHSDGLAPDSSRINVEKYFSLTTVLDAKNLTSLCCGKFE